MMSCLVSTLGMNLVNAKLSELRRLDKDTAKMFSRMARSMSKSSLLDGYTVQFLLDRIEEELHKANGHSGTYKSKVLSQESHRLQRRQVGLPSQTFGPLLRLEEQTIAQGMQKRILEKLDQSGHSGTANRINEREGSVPSHSATRESPLSKILREKADASRRMQRYGPSRPTYLEPSYSVTPEPSTSTVSTGSH